MAILVVAAYAAFGSLWILTTHGVMDALAPEAAAHRRLHAVVDWLSVAGTSVFLSLLVRRAFLRLENSEREKRQSVERYRTLVEESLAGIYAIEDGRFIYANPRMEEIFGYAAGQIAGLPVELLVAPQDRSLVAENLRKRMSGETLRVRYSFHGQRRDGRVVDVEVIGARADLDGKPAILGMLLDQTEHHILQKELVHAQKMELVGRLAGGVAHDFNNLLTAIMGLAQMTSAALPEGDPRREDVDEIERCTERAAALTRQLLAFSRKQAAQPRLLDPGSVVRGAEKMLRRAAGERVTVKIAAEARGRIKADPGQLEQVLLNLVVNARDAMSDGGTLEISVGDVELSRGREAAGRRVPAGRYVVLTVRDTGTGMTSEILARIFDPFFTTKEAGKGTGLGLGVVEGIVKDGGGHILVETVPGAGTAFHVHWPTADGASRAEPAAAGGGVRGGRETVLLVDDDPGVRGVLRRALESRGYRVRAAEGAAQALAESERLEDPLKLLVTDVVLPEGDGPELADRVSRRHPGVRTLFISGHIAEPTLRRRVSDARHGFLAKPFSPAVFLDRVREVLDAPL